MKNLLLLESCFLGKSPTIFLIINKSKFGGE